MQANGVLRINSHIKNLKPAEKKVAEYILQNSEEVIHLSITRLAEEVGVSEATIVKFCQRMGYSGYQELKIMLAQDKEKKDQEHIYGEIDAGDSINTIVSKIFQIYEQSLNNTKKLIQPDQIEKCIKLLLAARKIFFFGFGASGIVARDAELKFIRIDYRAEAFVDSHTQKTVSSLLGEKDVIIAISNSGRTRELIEALEIAKGTGCSIIGITSNMGSPLTELADVVLLTFSKETPFRGSALASRMAQLTIIDVLFLGLATGEYDNTTRALEKTRLALQESKI